jgi:hypothetical protein
MNGIWMSDHSGPEAIKAQNLAAAQEAAERGDLQPARNRIGDAAQIAPQEIEDWLRRAEAAQSIEEAIACLNQVSALLPANPEITAKIFLLANKLVKQDPFIAYDHETHDMYHVLNSSNQAFRVPKFRLTQESALNENPALLRSAHRWLWVALAGLLLAGLGAVLFAPLAASSAILLNLKPVSKAVRIQSLIVVIMSSSLWLVGLLLGVVFLVHMI